MLVNLTGLFLFLFKSETLSVDYFVNLLSVPATFGNLITQPWSLFTYMFLHKDLWHLIGNLLLFLISGRLFEEFLGSKRLVANYILAGLFGAIFYMLCYNLFPVFDEMKEYSLALGASASILGLLVAVAFLVPNYILNLFLVGEVRLKYVAMVLIFIDLISISKSNPGGHLSHLGGAIWGWIYILYYKKGTDLSLWLQNILDSLKRLFTGEKKSKLKIVHKRTLSDEEFNAIKKTKEQIMDELLDKISKSGYESLTKEEQKTLYKISNELNKH